MLDGPRFLRSSQLLTGALVSDLNATVLAMAVALFPAINADRFGGSPRTLGLLTTALAVGGILGSGLSGPLSRVARQGRAMLLVVAGVADVSSVVLRTTIIQVATPDAYRGRTSAAEFVVGRPARARQLPRRGGRLADLARHQRATGGLACVGAPGSSPWRFRRSSVTARGQRRGQPQPLRCPPRPRQPPDALIVVVVQPGKWSP